MYYLTNALALPGALAGAVLGVAEVSTAAAVAMIVLTAFNINSWLSPGFGIPGIMQPNAVTWTISTLGFFYLVFPCILPRIKRMQTYHAGIAIMYWLQFALWFAFAIPASWIAVIVLCDDIGSEWGEEPSGCPQGFEAGASWYWSARAFPLSRLPVFIAGCMAAFHRMRDDDPQPAVQLANPTTGRAVPKHQPAAIFCCACCGNPDACCVGGSVDDWASRADIRCTPPLANDASHRASFSRGRRCVAASSPTSPRSW